jgi:hypothetical protein
MESLWNSHTLNFDTKVYSIKIISETENRTGGVAQVVEHLLCKHKALSSNTSLTKKKKTHHKKGLVEWLMV